MGRTLFIAAIVLMPILGGCKGGHHQNDVKQTASNSAATSVNGAVDTNCVPLSTASTTRHPTQVSTATAGHSPPAASLTKTGGVPATTAKRTIPIGRIKPGGIVCPPEIQSAPSPAT